ncbi:MAG TPA: rod shape-determining protein MreC [Rhizomicrobium sp.]|jgi:rod shape-determining protein MreC|nr:rod shape-determining protein MreC [Rhizomicrobium sp.]
MANGWKIARGRGNAQLPLAIVAILAIVLVLAGRAQSTLFDRARTSFSDWTKPALTWISAPLDGAANWFHNFGHIFVVYQDNLKLKQENARLRQWQNAALVLNERLKRYQLLLNAVPDPSLSSVTARVIGRASRPFLDTMILDAGKSNGIKPGEAVVDDRGMIGRIFLAGNRTSWVLLLTDLNSRIPVMIQPGHIQAIMAGDNTSTPTLDTLAQRAAPKPGDQIVTSGDGGLIPPGLPVGVVISDGSGGLRVALLADSASSEDVRVVDFKIPPEQPPAPSPDDLPASAAGLKPEAPPAPQTLTPLAPPPVLAAPPLPNATKPSALATKPANALATKPATQTPPNQTPPSDDDDTANQ